MGHRELAGLANGAAAFNDVTVPDDVRRKLNLLRLGIVLPAPNRPGAATELAEITTRLDSTYATGKFEYQGRQLTLDEANILIAESRDPAETRALYEGFSRGKPSEALCRRCGFALASLGPGGQLRLDGGDVGQPALAGGPVETELQGKVARRQQRQLLDG